MRIAHFGTFDVDNYGDLLFPHIVQWRCSNAELTHVSPLGVPTRFSDSLPTVSVEHANEMNFDAVMVGGGNIVHLERTTLPAYREVAGTAYPSLWLGAAVMAARKKLPLVFNGPGMGTSGFRLLKKRLAGAALGSAGYLAFRESHSSEIAARISRHGTAVTIPDTAFDLVRMWPAGQGHTQDDQHYFVVHVNSRYQESVETTARSLDLISSRLRIPARLVPIGPCHGDIELADGVSASMNADHTVDPAMSIQGMARVISGASLYVGSSMHGFITALVYGVPALLVLNEDPMPKFSAVCETAGLSPPPICEGWRSVPGHIEDAVHLPVERLERIHRQLDRHWEVMLETICSGEPCLLPGWVFPWRGLVTLSRCIEQGAAMVPAPVRHIFSGRR